MTAILTAPTAQSTANPGLNTRTYLATLADRTVARVTVSQGYHPALGGGEIAQVRSQVKQPIVGLAIAPTANTENKSVGLVTPLR